MSNPTKKMIVVYEMMKDGKSFNFDNMVEKLGCKPVTAMVLVCALRRDCGAEIDTERDGRKVVSYKLTNAAAIASKMVLTKGAKTPKTPKVARVSTTKLKTVLSRKSTKAAADDDGIPTLEISEIDSDEELSSLKAELGLTDLYAE